jgi:preprotein translocase subunit SecE
MKAVAKKELPVVAFSGRRKAIVAKKNEADQETASGFNPAEFFQETKEELAKVVWPSRQQGISESLAVLSMVALIASLIYFIDKFFGWAATQVFG